MQNVQEKIEKKELGVTEARKEFGTLVSRVQYEGDTFVISRHGKPAAVVVPLKVYERWREERKQLFEVIREIQQANPDADPKQVMQDVLKAQQAVRR